MEASDAAFDKKKFNVPKSSPVNLSQSKK